MRIGFPLGARANYSSIRSAMLACRTRGATVLPVLYASAADPGFNDVRTIIARDGFEPAAVLPCQTNGAMAVTTGVALTQWATLLPVLSPDAVVVVGDRHEQLAPATAAAYANVKVAHSMGGEVSGSIDDKVRDAITTLSDVHLVATERAGDRVCTIIGESFWKESQPYKLAGIYQTGCPRIDTAAEAIGTMPRDPLPYIIVAQHPVTTEADQAEHQMRVTLDAAAAVALEKNAALHLIWPNADAGTSGTNIAIRRFLNDPIAERLEVLTHRTMSPDEYARLMARALCIVGNSSSGLREGAWIGTPCVNVGSRQQGREHSANVVHAPHSRDEIVGAMKVQIGHGPFASSKLYGDGAAGEKVAEVLLG